MSFLGVLILFAFVRGLLRSEKRQTRPVMRVSLRRLLLGVFSTSLLVNLAEHVRVGPFSGLWLGLWLCMLAMALLFVWPELYIARVAVPRGWVRLSWLLERAGGGALEPCETPASWALSAARAYVRKPAPAKLAFIERKLARCPELPTSGVAAWALIALQRGEREAARDLCDALFALPARELPASVRRTATDVLALDALVRDRPYLVTALAEQRGPRGALARLLGLLVQPERTRRSVARIWLAWALAPRRWQTRKLVLRWLRRTPAPQLTGMQAYVALFSRTGQPSANGLAAAVTALDELRDDPAFHRNCARQAAIAGLDAELVMAQVLEPAERELYQWMLDERLPLAWLRGTGERGHALHARVSDERLARLRGLVDELQRRLDTRKDLAPIDEWRAWAVLRRAAADASDTPGDCAGVYALVHESLISWVVRLANVRSQRVLARAVSIYVRDLGLAAHALESQTLLENNVEATRHDRLATEPLLGRALLSDLGDTQKWRWMARCAFYGWLIASAYNVALWLDPAGRAMHGFAWLLLGIGIVIGPSWLESYVDVWLDAGELTIQNKRGRHVLCSGDIAAVRALGSKLLYFRLHRRPLWLKRHLLAVTPSVEHSSRLGAHLTRLRRNG